MTNMAISRSAAPAPSLPPSGVAPTNAAALLPAPESPSTIAAGDAITQLLALSSALSTQQMQLGQGQVTVAEAQRKAAAEQRKEALHRAVEAARKARDASASGFLSKITDNIGLTGLVGLATFNFGLVAADVTAHKTGLQGKSTNVMDLGLAVGGNPLAYLAAKGLEKAAPGAMNSSAFAATMLGGPAGYALERAAEKMTPDDFEMSFAKVTSVKDDDVRVANKVAMVVAMAAVAATATAFTFGATAPGIVALCAIGVSTATQIGAETGATKEIFGEKATGYVTLGGAALGAAASLATGVAAIANGSNIATGLTIVNSVTSIVQGAAAIESGVIGLQVARYEHAADHANADAQDAKSALVRLEKLVDGIIADLKEANESSQRSTETLQEAASTNDQTLLLAGSKV